jgi:2,5-dihydroxypyridine 5,6-dioxygenase
MVAYHYSGLGPPNLGRQAELLPVLMEVLGRSNVRAGQKVVLYTDTKKNKDLVDAFFQASILLGAETAVLYTTPRQNDRTPFPIALHAMHGADMILDLASAMWIYTEALSQLLDEGKRILSCVSDVDTCIKLAPTDVLVNRVNAAGPMMGRAEVLKVTSQAGSDLTLNKKGRKGSFQDGLAPNPGDWDCYPAFQVAAAPLETSANGRLVLQQGDLLVTLKRIVLETVTLDMRDGRIVNIQGGADALMLRDWFAQWDDEKAYTTSHIGFGCDPRSEVGSNNLMEWETIAGGIMIAFGANTLRFLGGSNRSAAHLDIVMRQADFALDCAQVVRGGEFVHPDLK